MGGGGGQKGINEMTAVIKYKRVVHIFYRLVT